MSNCGRCEDICHGNVVTVNGKYFHQYCFSCLKCSKDLLQDGYFFLDGEIYCKDDYFEVSNTEKCAGCSKYVEGEVISVLETIFHLECFGCHRCGKLFPSGADVVFDGEVFLCEDCDQSNKQNQYLKNSSTLSTSNKQEDSKKNFTPSLKDAYKNNQEPVFDERAKVALPLYQKPVETRLEQKPAANSRTLDSQNSCAGCRNVIRSGQALLALDKQWHLWCFTCNKCGCLLAGEYMGRDGLPYCEDDYQKEFGVTCAGCDGYITGKVLQAGEKHYHPQCSRCAKCQKIFGEGEEMYLQGSEIWHPQCSEEYRRENEEMLNSDSENRREPPSYESTVESVRPWNHSYIRTNEERSSVSRTVDDTKDPPVKFDNPYSSKNSKQYNTSNGNVDDVPSVNGYDYHTMQFSNSSDGGPSEKPSEHSRASRPAGFRSVKPPQPVMNASAASSRSAKSVDFGESDEEDAPPVPPPPTRGSSNSWKEKYATAGVYAAKPFQKQTVASQLLRGRPLSFVESAMRKESTENIFSATEEMSFSKMRHTSDSVSSGGDEEGTGRRDTGPLRQYKKGLGYNKLQLRKLQKQQQQPSSSKPNGPQQPADSHHSTGYTAADVNKGDPSDKTSYLTDDEFVEVFNMTREKFRSLPKWRQEDMKRAKYLL